MTFLTDTELDREHTTRRYVCPTCHAERNKPCRRTGSGSRHTMDVAHTSRYLRAVAAGLVPALPGDGNA